jgi:hypothetical protein
MKRISPGGGFPAEWQIRREFNSEFRDEFRFHHESKLRCQMTVFLWLAKVDE